MLKDLVRHINSYEKDGSIYSLNIINTLKVNIRNDVNGAYDLARPMFDKYPDIRNNSTSFVDFLFKICGVREDVDGSLSWDPSFDTATLEDDKRAWEIVFKQEQTKFTELNVKYTELQLIVSELRAEKIQLETKFKALQEDYDDCKRRLYRTKSDDKNGKRNFYDISNVDSSDDEGGVPHEPIQDDEACSNKIVPYQRVKNVQDDLKKNEARWEAEIKEIENIFLIANSDILLKLETFKAKLKETTKETEAQFQDISCESLRFEPTLQEIVSTANATIFQKLEDIETRLEGPTLKDVKEIFSVENNHILEDLKHIKHKLDSRCEEADFQQIEATMGDFSKNIRQKLGEMKGRLEEPLLETIDCIITDSNNFILKKLGEMKDELKTPHLLRQIKTIMESSNETIQQELRKIKGESEVPLLQSIKAIITTSNHSVLQKVEAMKSPLLLEEIENSIAASNETIRLKLENLKSKIANTKEVEIKIGDIENILGDEAASMQSVHNRLQTIHEQITQLVSNSKLDKVAPTLIPQLEIVSETIIEPLARLADLEKKLVLFTQSGHIKTLLQKISVNAEQPLKEMFKDLEDMNPCAPIFEKFKNVKEKFIYPLQKCISDVKVELKELESITLPSAPDFRKHEKNLRDSSATLEKALERIEENISAHDVKLREINEGVLNPLHRHCESINTQVQNMETLKPHSYRAVKDKLEDVAQAIKVTPMDLGDVVDDIARSVPIFEKFENIRGNVIDPLQKCVSDVKVKLKELESITLPSTPDFYEHEKKLKDSSAALERAIRRIQENMSTHNVKLREINESVVNPLYDHCEKINTQIQNMETLKPCSYKTVKDKLEDIAQAIKVTPKELGIIVGDIERSVHTNLKKDVIEPLKSVNSDLQTIIDNPTQNINEKLRRVREMIEPLNKFSRLDLDALDRTDLEAKIERLNNIMKTQPETLRVVAKKIQKFIDDHMDSKKIKTWNKLIDVPTETLSKLHSEMDQHEKDISKKFANIDGILQKSVSNLANFDKNLETTLRQISPPFEMIESIHKKFIDMGNHTVDSSNKLSEINKTYKEVDNKVLAQLRQYLDHYVEVEKSQNEQKIVDIIRNGFEIQEEGIFSLEEYQARYIRFSQLFHDLELAFQQGIDVYELPYLLKHIILPQILPMNMFDLSQTILDKETEDIRLMLYNGLTEESKDMLEKFDLTQERPDDPIVDKLRKFIQNNTATNQTNHSLYDSHQNKSVEKVQKKLVNILESRHHNWLRFFDVTKPIQGNFEKYRSELARHLQMEVDLKSTEDNEKIERYIEKKSNLKTKKLRGKTYKLKLKGKDLKGSKEVIKRLVSELKASEQRFNDFKNFGEDTIKAAPNIVKSYWLSINDLKKILYAILLKYYQTRKTLSLIVRKEQKDTINFIKKTAIFQDIKNNLEQRSSSTRDFGDIYRQYVNYDISLVLNDHNFSPNDEKLLQDTKTEDEVLNFYMKKIEQVLQYDKKLPPVKRRKRYYDDRPYEHDESDEILKGKKAKHIAKNKTNAAGVKTSQNMGVVGFEKWKAAGDVEMSDDPTL